MKAKKSLDHLPLTAAQAREEKQSARSAKVHYASASVRPAAARGQKNPSKNLDLLRRRHFLSGSLTLAAGALAPPLWAGNRLHDVVVIGAGLAGLCAAMKLAEQGLDILVIEANKRVGGRAYTLALPSGGQREFGGVTVGGGYTYLRALAKRLGVNMAPMQPSAEGLCLAVDGKLIDTSDWKRSANNPLPPKERDALPGGLLARYISGVTLPGGDAPWYEQSNRTLDIPLGDFLRSRGASPEAMRLIASNLNAPSLSQVSALEVVERFRAFSEDRRQGHRSSTIKGGTQTLALRMARALGTRRIELGKKALHIRSKKKEVHIRCADGETLRARRCIIAVSHAAAANISIDSRLSPHKQRSRNAMGHTDVVVTLLRSRSAWWERDGLSPNMWCDSIPGRVFAIVDEHGEPSHLRAFTMGAQAAALNMGSPRAIANKIIKTLARIRPASRGEITAEAARSWARDPLFGCAFTCFLPGFVSSEPQLKPRFYSPEGLLHFAGEHTELISAGLEAALRSGDRAAREAIERL